MENGSEVTSSVRVIEAPGRLPEFWDRRTVFVANLLGLFFGNEEETRCLAAEVGEVDSYGGRLVPIIDLLYRGREGRNLLVLERSPDPSLCRYFEELAGLSLPEQRILSHQEYLALGKSLGRGEKMESKILETFSDHSSEWLDGYVTDGILQSLGQQIGKPTISSHAGSLRGNNKRLLHQFLEASGFPVIETYLAHSADEVMRGLEELRSSGFNAGVVKSAIGASGIGLKKIESLAETGSRPPAIPDYFFYEGACLVQGWLDPGQQGVEAIRSPSVQLFVSDEEVTLYDLTEQILSHASVHEGNESPPPYLLDRPELREELLRQGRAAGVWLHSQGYRGTGSVDFLVVERQGESTEVYTCEINARVTGATYPSVLARHFMPEGAWLLRNLRFTEPLEGQELLKRLKESGDLFLPGQSEAGVMPVNFNFGSDGLVHKGQFLCLAHSSAGSHVLLELAELDLPCEPDRD